MSLEDTLEQFLIQKDWRSHFSDGEWTDFCALTQKAQFDLSAQENFWSKLLLSWDTRSLDNFRSLYTEISAILKFYIQLMVKEKNWPLADMETLFRRLSEAHIEQQEKQLLFWRFEYEKKHNRIQLAEIDNQTAQAESYNLLKLNLAFSDVPQEEKEIVHVALDCLMGLLDATFCSLFLFEDPDELTGKLYTLDAKYSAFQVYNQFQVSSTGFFQRFLMQKRLWAEKFFITPENKHLFSDVHILNPQINTFMVCQINLEPHLTGFVLVGHDEINALDGFKRFFNMLCINFANAIQSTYLNARINEMAIRDAITGLFNRHHIEERLQHSFAVSQRYNREFSVLLVDIDHFKNINDTLGHQAGDQVLREVAQIMKYRIRATDIIGRYGGEEFLIILQETGLEGARILAENLVRKLQETPILLDDKSELNITISVGYATYPRNASQMNSLIRIADEGMYWAKNNGRNQVGYTGTG